MRFCSRMIAGATVAVVLFSLAAQTPAQPGDPGQVQRKTFVYRESPEAKLEIVVHFPPGWKATDRRPALVFFFGGGWNSGNIKQFESQADYLAGRGLVTARADYRVKSRHKVTPDKCVEDCKSAVRWLRQNAVKLGIDPQRVAAGGGSAGGHTAIATFTTQGLEAAGDDMTVSSRPNLLVLFNPVLDTTPYADKMGGAALAKKLSPNENLTRDLPPTIIFFGTNDKLMDGTTEFFARAKELGLKAELYTAEGQKHGFFNKSPWREATLLQADRFLTKHGYLQGEPTVTAKPDVSLKLAAQGSE